MANISIKELQNVDKTLNTVKNGIMNNNITKEQAEMLIKKCDILIKKNKKNLDRMEKMYEAQNQHVNAVASQQEVVEHYWEEEILDKMVMVDDRMGDDVRMTIEDWFGVRLQEEEEGVYFQKFDGLDCIYFFDEEEDMLRGMAVRYDNLTQVIKDLDDSYKRVGDRQMWYDRRLDMDVTVYGNWLIHEFEPGYCKYAEAIKRFTK